MYPYLDTGIEEYTISGGLAREECTSPPPPPPAHEHAGHIRLWWSLQLMRGISIYNEER